jgi:hypothetical protein
MSAEIIPLHGNHAPEQRQCVSADSLAFLGNLLIAMADSMAGRRHGQIMDPNPAVTQLLTLIGEVDQAPR